jgi:hypothetical protein
MNDPAMNGHAPALDCQDLLGLPLERALSILAVRGAAEPIVIHTAAPAYFARKDPRPRPDERVVRARRLASNIELCAAGFHNPIAVDMPDKVMLDEIILDESITNIVNDTKASHAPVPI